ncbi:hypothetical protein WR25_20883 [Diploscapter pachys]|uniref:Uncharacterized protein n=1 Tax=Diploscapter pachys TaxID=2018661 RepID=A0A2A2M573_9BILA|nr:hypothetical protein WR25_20883 [Diploscapter pachys]
MGIAWYCVTNAPSARWVVGVCSTRSPRVGNGAARRACVSCRCCAKPTISSKRCRPCSRRPPAVSSPGVWSASSTACARPGSCRIRCW